ncbi:endolytic transglycosylase MltG [Falsarthrobacter nasiphocae]|uniref:Endolytic murein transglycosylase n=1 Tax=Falsarthrobacter nasiphocae TaxID=189863 RepID=A0AAE3YJ34_9MICC|nr:endolytic transglycosylase MltG [Falsarthrobacter nasiphocae]MDR6892976.1 UPF0755 protein [Falsarthrobacter nasiphocae]
MTDETSPKSVPKRARRARSAGRAAAAESAASTLHGSHLGVTDDDLFEVDDEWQTDGPRTVRLSEAAEVPSAEELTPRERRLIARRARQRRRRRRLIVLASVVVTFAVVVGLITFGLRQLLGMNEPQSYPGPGETAVTLEVKPGMATSSIYAKLKSLDVIASEQGFARSFDQLSDGATIQPGTYELKTKMSNEEAVKALVAKDMTKVYYVPIAGNMRIDEVTKTLSEKTRMPLTDFQKIVEDPKRFGLSSKAKNLEGYLAPGEYRFDIKSTPEQMVRQMVDRQLSILKAGGVTDADKQYIMLTKASIVEAEGNPTNYATIAGALENRVERPNEDTGGFINSDATVTYGLGSRTLHISEDQKRDKSNKYNTYANKGLPIGPIGSPEKKAIEATINPEKNDYYYWVTIDIKTGETLYARTYAEHQKNEVKYQQYCADHPGVCE